MFPFRELEVHDLFLLDGNECEKVGDHKYIVYDDLFEPESMEVADPNMLVEYVEEEEDDDDYEYEIFFSKLLDLATFMEENGHENLSTKDLIVFAKAFLEQR